MSHVRRSTRRSAWAVGFVAVVLAATVSAIPLPAGSPSAEAQAVDERPNILIVITDDQRDGMDFMPRTRHFFGWQGRTYTNAYVTTPQCCPSRASIMTGRYAHNHTIHHNDDSAAGFPLDETLQAKLQDAGYTTGLVGKYLNVWPSDVSPPNFDWFAYMNFGFWNTTWNLNGLMTPIEGYNTDIIGDKAADFIEAQRSSRDPWLMFVAPFGPHRPYRSERAYRRIKVPEFEPNPAMLETDRRDKPPFVRAANMPYQPDGARIRTKQYRSLRSIDDLVTRLAAELRRAGEENTIAVFMSDNGYLWGEHGLQRKSVPYTEAVKVPMYIRWPGVIPGRSVDDRIVANIDLMPTLLDAAGVGAETIGDADGRSLLDETWRRDRLLLEFSCQSNHRCNRWASTRTPKYQYVEHYDAHGAVTFREYYNLVKDPWQLQNLYGDKSATNDPPLAPLIKQLAADRTCTGTACP